jgi:hypothetical protein
MHGLTTAVLSVESVGIINFDVRGWLGYGPASEFAWDACERGIVPMNASRKSGRAAITALFIVYMIVSMLFFYCCVFIFMTLAAIVLAIITGLRSGTRSLESSSHNPGLSLYA